MNALLPPQPGQPIAPPQMPALMPPAATPAPAPPPVTHDVTIIRTKKYAQAKVMAVAPEEFGIERNTRTIKDCNYCFHKIPNHTEGQLIAQGYDPEQVKRLPSYAFTSNTEEIARDTVDEEFFSADSMNRTARPIEVYEHYVRMDYKGDGKPCLYKVTTGGAQGEVLIKTTKDDKGKETKGPDIEEFDAIPFAAVTPVPQPHRFFGRSIADQVMDIQRIKTALTRGVLDNAYMVIAPRIEVVESGAGPNTIDDLLSVRPNGIVRVKTQGTLTPFETPSIAGDLMPVLAYMDGTRELRTGVTRQGQGVDANALQNQSATAVNQVFSATQARMKLIARIIAETGVRDLFSLLHATIRKHGQEAATVKLRNQWVSVDPRGWKTRNDMTINVGLGTGGKAEQFAQTMAIGNVQKEMVAAGKTNIVDDQKLFNTAASLSKIMGHKNPDQFFNNPSEKNPDGSPKYPAPPPPVDPKVQAAQQKAQSDQAAAAQKAQQDQAKAQLDAMHQQAKAQADIAVAKMKAEMQAELAKMNGAIKMALAEQSAHHAQQGHVQEMTHTQQQHHAAQSETALDMIATAHAHDIHTEQSQQSHQHSIEAMKAKPTVTDA